jgi:hypothetical protein
MIMRPSRRATTRAGTISHPAATPAREVFGTAAGRYEMNRSLDRTDHMMPSASMRAGAEPVPLRVAMRRTAGRECPG